MSKDDQTATEGSKMDALVKVVLVFFISLLSFSVGTFVGKQVSDSDHRQAALEGEAHDTQAGAHDESAHDENREVASVPDEHAVSDEDVSNLADEFVEAETPADKDGYKSFSRKTASAPDEGHAPAPTTTASHTPATTAAKHPAPAAIKPPAPAVEKIIQGEPPTSGKVVAEKRQPSNVLPAMGGAAVGKFTVQVGSYGTEGEAKLHAAKLKSGGWDAFYVPADIKGKTWYRVSVGLFDDAVKAKTFMQTFQKESNTKSALVQKIIQ